MFMDLPLTLQPKESVCGLVGESSPLSPLPPPLCLHVETLVNACQVSPSVLAGQWEALGTKPQSWFLFTVAMTTVGGVWGDGNYGLVLFKV